jgi:hypothetical protein
MAELGLGWLTLPGAQVCTKRSEASCEEGDSSPDIEVWQLYRANPRAAIGAGITLGLVPTNDAFGNDQQGIAREHSRSYFAIEGMGRYYPWTGRTTEAWLGLTGGLVVVSDSYSSAEPSSGRALVGQSGSVIRTEGYTIGVGAGGDYLFADNWSVGLQARYGIWFLPQRAETNVFGDEASLTGRNSMFAFVLTFAYRIAL